MDLGVLAYTEGVERNFFRQLCAICSAHFHSKSTMSRSFTMERSLAHVRTKNMSLLKAEVGTIRNLAKYTLQSYWPEDRVQRMCNGQNISDLEARQVEGFAEKPEGWMDVPHMDMNTSYAEYNLLLSIRNLQLPGLALMLIKKYVEMLAIQEQAYRGKSIQ